MSQDTIIADLLLLADRWDAESLELKKTSQVALHPLERAAFSSVSDRVQRMASELRMRIKIS